MNNFIVQINHSRIYIKLIELYHNTIAIQITVEISYFFKIKFKNGKGDNIKPFQLQSFTPSEVDRLRYDKLPFVSDCHEFNVDIVSAVHAASILAPFIFCSFEYEQAFTIANQ